MNLVSVEVFHFFRIEGFIPVQVTAVEPDEFIDEIIIELIPLPPLLLIPTTTATTNTTTTTTTTSTTTTSTTNY